MYLNTDFEMQHLKGRIADKWSRCGSLETADGETEQHRNVLENNFGFTYWTKTILIKYICRSNYENFFEKQSITYLQSTVLLLFGALIFQDSCICTQSQCLVLSSSISVSFWGRGTAFERIQSNVYPSTLSRIVKWLKTSY